MTVERVRVLLVEDDSGQVALINAFLGNTPGMEFHLTEARRLADALEHLSGGRDRYRAAGPFPAG